ncbi:MAG: M23 family metallopeptidase [Rhodocyclaceae bacterium]|nr:M23 family metallopeptidase [Rhodocyclaceae bacterium]
MKTAAAALLRLLCCLALCLCLLPGNAQARLADRYDFKVTSEKTATGFRLVAHNNGVAPVSVRIALTQVENVSGLGQFPILSVVPPGRTGVVLGTVLPANPARDMSFRMNYHWGLGDFRAHPSLDARYRLPFRDGLTFLVGQATGGPIATHSTPSSLHAVDFSMPEDTPIVAARAGTVIYTEFEHSEGGMTPDKEGEANVIIILHDDGSRAIYAHLAPGGVTVSPGQRVREGEVIGLSGNTGYSSGPHLHFAIQQVRDTGQEFIYESIPFKFSVGNPPYKFTARYGMLATADYTRPGALPPQYDKVPAQQARTALAQSTRRTPDAPPHESAQSKPARADTIVLTRELPPEPVSASQLLQENRAALFALGALLVLFVLYRSRR